MSELYLSSSPHIHSGETTDKVMRAVIYSLLPACAVAIYFFGLPALLVLLICTIGCVATEAICNRLFGSKLSIADGSAALTGILLALNMPPFDAVYRRNRSEFMTELQRTGRERSAESTIEKRDIKKMVRSLRDKRAVWYAPDQRYDRKGSEVVPFFGIPAMHTTATSTLARLGRAVVVPFFPRRLPDSTYEMTLLPAFENFPGDDAVADTRRYVEVLERHIRSCPEQYFWVHRKFKNLPDEYPDYYEDLDALK